MKIINNFPKITKLDNIENELIDKAPIDHASTDTTYGASTSVNYGHVKLSDNYKSSDGAANSGVAASSKAVADAYAEINSNLFKTVDYNIKLAQLSWIKTQAGKYYAYYSISNLNATKVLGVMMTDWASLRETDNITVSADENNIIIGSNVNTFIVDTATAYVRVHYV